MYLLQNAAWDKIAAAYNAATTEPKAVEQLRCKYDNLKKEVRKHEAEKRQNFYKTGGGPPTANNIKESTKMLHEKVKCLVNFSVQGMDSVGDSDVFVNIRLLGTEKFCLIKYCPCESTIKYILYSPVLINIRK